MKMLASSFADPNDIAAFKKCKAQGKSDKECFKVGDNAIGCWGDSTAEGTGPSCALHVSVISARWGSKAKGKNKKVHVRYGSKEVTCVLKDICGKKDRIDLNPDAVAAIGLKPPILVEVHWSWSGNG
jgi:hypothetical protein